MPPTGLEAVYLENRDRLVRFLVARGAGDAAEDLLHDLWIKVSARPSGPIDNPLSYLFRAADTLMIDRHRSRTQAQARDHAWSEVSAGEAATSERVVAARQEVARVAQVLAGLGERRATVFRRARLDGVPQRQIAAELGVSLSTVEADLRAACRALVALKDET
ncbi:RNA polymerase sigma factor [Sphingomonas sp. BK580]|uniref:RNA polymerase sigma factor n=1 Tax=Sphingomonas sp. BK580 TaxID=2586972 RepID=UPI001618C8C6|nr:RNA polymerase sigma factor [Sphingomonas sp. BK580]MBB3693446.1 RNA polymerase sigma-70 factor (ECF subfamily) [Sphingomonas sp. BK580]